MKTEQESDDKKRGEEEMIMKDEHSSAGGGSNISSDSTSESSSSSSDDDSSSTSSSSSSSSGSSSSSTDSDSSSSSSSSSSDGSSSSSASSSSSSKEQQEHTTPDGVETDSREDDNLLLLGDDDGDDDDQSSSSSRSSGSLASSDSSSTTSGSSSTTTPSFYNDEDHYAIHNKRDESVAAAASSSGGTESSPPSLSSSSSSDNSPLAVSPPRNNELTDMEIQFVDNNGPFNKEEIEKEALLKKKVSSSHSSSGSYHNPEDVQQHEEIAAVVCSGDGGVVPSKSDDHILARSRRLATPRQPRRIQSMIVTSSIVTTKHHNNEAKQNGFSQSLPLLRAEKIQQQHEEEEVQDELDSTTPTNNSNNKQRLQNLVENLSKAKQQHRPKKSVRELVAMDVEHGSSNNNYHGGSDMAHVFSSSTSTSTSSLAAQHDIMLLADLESLLGALVKLSDELELISVFQRNKKTSRTDYLASKQAQQAYSGVLTHLPVLDSVFMLLQPILQYYVEIQEPKDHENLLLSRARKIVRLLVEMTHRVSHRQEWSNKEDTAYSTLLELLETTAIEIDCMHAEVPPPEYLLSGLLERALTNTNRWDELETLKETSDLGVFRRVCYEILLGTDQACPDTRVLGEICGVSSSSLLHDERSRQSSPQAPQGERLAAVPVAAVQVLDDIRGDPLPRPLIMASILRRIIPPHAMEDSLLSSSKFRSSVDKSELSTNSRPVVITGAPEDLNDPDSLGLAGIGKTTMAAMVAGHVDVRRFFRDGIAWVRIGTRELNYDRYTTCLRELLLQLGLYDGDPPFPEFVSVPLESRFEQRRREEGFMVYARNVVTELLQKRRLLVILDDVHILEDLKWFQFCPGLPTSIQIEKPTGRGTKRRSIGGPKLLVTTRYRDLGDVGDAIDVDLLSERESVRLLLTEAGLSANHVAGASREVHSIVQECAGHPLAIKALGRWLRLKHATSGVINSVEEIHREVERSVERASESIEAESPSMLFEILGASLSPTVDGASTKVLKLCFMAFVVVFCENNEATTQTTVPLGVASFLFENLLSSDAWASLFRQESLFNTRRSDAAALIPEGLVALGLLKIVKSSDPAETASDRSIAGSLLGEDKVLSLAHFVHSEYVDYLLEESKDIRSLTADARRAWNELFSKACLQREMQWDADSTDLLKEYAVKYLVVHLLRAEMLTEAAELLVDESFARGRVFTLGRGEASRSCIEECERLYDLVMGYKEESRNVRPRRVMKESYRVIGNSIAPNHAGIDAKERQVLKIEAGRSHILLASSLARKKCWETAIAHWTRAKEIFQSVYGSVELIAALLYTISIAETELGRFDRAGSCLQECLKIRQAVHGDRHVLFAKTIQKFGDVYCQQGNYRESMESYRWALEVMETDSARADSSLDIGELLFSIGKLYQGRGEQDPALRYFQDAMRSKKEFFEGEHPELASIYQVIGESLLDSSFLEESVRLNKLYAGVSVEKQADVLVAKGVLSGLQGDQDDALLCYEGALEVIKKTAPYDYGRLVPVLLRSGLVYAERREDKEMALAIFQHALRMQHRKKGTAPLEIARTLSCIAEYHESQGESRDGLKYLKRVLKIENSCIPNSLEVAKTNQTMAVLYRALGKKKKAINSYEEAIRIRRSVYGQANEVTAALLTSLGDVRYSMGEYREAYDEYQEALKVRRDASDSDEEAVASSLYTLGRCAHRFGESHEALSLLRECLVIQKAWHGETSLEAAETLNTMGTLKAKMGDLDGAMQLLSEAKTIRTIHNDNVKLSGTLLNLGNVQRQKGELDAAITNYETSLQLRKAELGDDHEKVADILVSIGNLQSEQDRIVEAKTAYNEARSILVSVYGNSHRRVADLLTLIGALEYRIGDMEQARMLLEESIQIRKEKGATKDKDFEQTNSLLESVSKALGDSRRANGSSAEANAT